MGFRSVSFVWFECLGGINWIYCRSFDSRSNWKENSFLCFRDFILIFLHSRSSRAISHGEKWTKFVFEYQDDHLRIDLGQRIAMNIINISLKFLASSSYAIIYIYANELFPTTVRNTGMGICSMVARIGAIIGTFCNDYLVEKISFSSISSFSRFFFSRHVFGFICH